MEIWSEIMKFMKFAMIATLGLSLTASQTAKGGVMESGGVKLTQSEVIAMNNDVTVEWRSGTGKSYYDPNGNMPYIYKGKLGEGKWKVTDNGTECWLVEEWWGKDFNCNWEYYRVGDDLFGYDIKDKETRKVYPATRTKGNNL
jgi:hypothetical protein